VRILKFLLLILAISYPAKSLELFKEYLSKLDKSQYHLENTPFFAISDDQMHDILANFFLHENKKEKLEFKTNNGHVTVFPYENNNFLIFSFATENTLCTLITGINENSGSVSVAKIDPLNNMPTPLDVLSRNIVIIATYNTINFFIVRTFSNLP
jgi:hypothetical protein